MTDIDKQIDEILKEAWRQGYYTNNNTNTSHFELATNDIKALISTAVREARIDEVEQFTDKFIGKALAHAELPNHFAYVLKDKRVAQLKEESK